MPKEQMYGKIREIFSILLYINIIAFQLPIISEKGTKNDIHVLDLRECLFMKEM